MLDPPAPGLLCVAPWGPTTMCCDPAIGMWVREWEGSCRPGPAHQIPPQACRLWCPHAGRRHMSQG